MELRIVPEALARIMHWVKLADKNEVSGFGKVVFRDGYPTVTEVCIVEQRNSPGTTELESNALSKAMFHMKDTPGTLQFWWHSHGHGATFFSHTDLQTIQELGQNGWLLASVFNVHGSVETSFYSQSPFPFYIDAIPLTQELLPLSTENRQALDADYRKKVRLFPIYGKRRWNRWERRNRKNKELGAGFEVENNDVYGPWISDLRDVDERWSDGSETGNGEAHYDAFS